jgi:hypothetical protein
MRLDPAVSQTKFEKQVARLEGQRDVLGDWGCWIRRVAYPNVDLIFVPRSPLLVTQPPWGVDPLRVHRTPWTSEDGALAARAFGARFGLDDFDQLPPSVTFRDPWTWQVLPHRALPTAIFVDDHGTATRVLQERHPETGLPFLCVPGTREYHSHPEHTGNAWVLHRQTFALFDLVGLVWRTCIRPVRPHLVAAGPVVPSWAPGVR